MEERLTCKYIPKEQCLASSWHCSLGMYLQVSLSSMSHKGWMDFFSHWSQISLGSKWQFCFSTGKGKMLENFSQYLCTSVLHTSTWICKCGIVRAINYKAKPTFLGML